LIGWTRRPYTAVMRWRYVPGKRNGVPAMWFNVPINFVLE
jgi:protein TonB